MKLTPSDLRNPKRKSGYNHVGYNVSNPRHDTKPYQADVYGGSNDKAGRRWKGPRRATAEQAAQDYCDFVNTGQVPVSAPLTYPQRAQAQRDSIRDDPEVQAALGVLRDARAQCKGRKGYIYCIGVKGDDYAVKVGYSVKPEARVRELQTGNPRELVLLATMEGTRDDESAIHQKHIRLNLIGEWFRKAPALLNEFPVAQSDGLDPKEVTHA